MKNFDEYEMVYRATIAVPKGEKIELHKILEGLTRRLEILGHEKFLVGHGHIHAIHEKDSEA
jgi:hypothetical protein